MFPNCTHKFIVKFSTLLIFINYIHYSLPWFCLLELVHVNPYHLLWLHFRTSCCVRFCPFYVRVILWRSWIIIFLSKWCFLAHCYHFTLWPSELNAWIMSAWPRVFIRIKYLTNLCFSIYFILWSIWSRCTQIGIVLTGTRCLINLLLTLILRYSYCCTIWEGNIVSTWSGYICVLIENWSIHWATLDVERGWDGLYYVDFWIVITRSRDLINWLLVLVFWYCDSLGVFEYVLVDIVGSWGWIIQI